MGESERDVSTLYLTDVISKNVHAAMVLNLIHKAGCDPSRLEIVGHTPA